MILHESDWGEEKCPGFPLLSCSSLFVRNSQYQHSQKFPIQGFQELPTCNYQLFCDTEKSRKRAGSKSEPRTSTESDLPKMEACSPQLAHSDSRSIHRMFFISIHSNIETNIQKSFVKFPRYLLNLMLFISSCWWFIIEIFHTSDPSAQNYLFNFLCLNK